jgi:spore coat protein A
MKLRLVVCLVGLSFGVGCGPENTETGEEGGIEQVRQAASPVQPRFVLQLPLPPVLAPTSSDATTDFYDLEARTGTARMRSQGNVTPIYGYNGIFPGPTIMATRGRRAVVRQRNSLSFNTTVHNHGHKVSPGSDGHPTDYIRPGTTKAYDYPNDQLGGTFWYHDHTMDVTGDHVYRGLAGFYLIRDPGEDRFNLPRGGQDVPLLIQDKTFSSTNGLLYSSSPFWEGFEADVPVVNGADSPNFNVANRRYRLRLLNGSNAREYIFSFRRAGSSTNEPFQVIASDGGLLAAPVTVTSLRMAPAERYDVVVNFGAFPLGTRIILANSLNEGPAIPQIMQFTVNRAEGETASVPSAFNAISRFNRAAAVGTYNITFDMNNGAWVLNGVPYDPARIDLRPRLDTPYIWRLVNRSNIMHPFHKHLVQFQVLSINGAAPPAIYAGWKDTVPVQPGQTVDIMFKNETFSGVYVFHCHRIEHEDHRMMLQEEVLGGSTSTAPPAGRRYKVIAKHSNKAMDVSGGNTANGAVVHQWDYVGGGNQQWNLIDAGGGLFKLQAAHSGRCLDVDAGGGTTNGAKVQQWDCNANTANMKFRLNRLADGAYEVRPSHSNKCIDVQGVSTANGAILHQWDCVGGANQAWRFETP